MENDDLDLDTALDELNLHIALDDYNVDIGGVETWKTGLGTESDKDTIDIIKQFEINNDNDHDDNSDDDDSDDDGSDDDDDDMLYTIYNPNEDDEEDYKEENIEDIDEDYNYHYNENDNDNDNKCTVYSNGEYINEDDLDDDDKRYYGYFDYSHQNNLSDDDFDEFLNCRYDDNADRLKLQLKECFNTITCKDYDDKIDTQAIKTINNIGLNIDDIIFQRSNLVTTALSIEDHMFADKSLGVESMRQLIREYNKSNEEEDYDITYRLQESIIVDIEATKASLGSAGMDLVCKLQDEIDNDLEDEVYDEIAYLKEHIEVSLETLQGLEDRHKLLYAYGYKSMFHTLDEQGKAWLMKINQLCESDEASRDDLERVFETVDEYIDRFENYENDQEQVVYELTTTVENFEKFLNDVVILQKYNAVTDIPQYDYYQNLLGSARKIIDEEGGVDEYTTLPSFKATILKELQESADALGKHNKASKRRRIEYKSIEEIQAQQICTGLIINEEAFGCLVAEIAQDFKTDLAFEIDALEAIQIAAEEYLIKLFKDSVSSAVCAGRDKIVSDDIHSVRSIAEVLSNNEVHWK